MNRTTDSPAQGNSSTRWAVPAVCVAGGIGSLVAGWVGGRPLFGVIGLALMLAVGAFFLWGARRSETLAGVRDQRDERISGIDRDATMVAGSVLLVAVLVMMMVEIARGNSGWPYIGLAAVSGVTYLLTFVYLRFRR